MDERTEEKGSLGRSLTLTLAAEAHFVPVVLRFVEESVQSFGMGREEALKLCLAAEEVFLYLCRRVSPAQSLDIRCSNGVYYGEVQFAFLAASLNLPGLNLAAGLSWEEEADGEEMGLLLAARSVDRLWLDAETHRRVRLGLVKERAYPAAPEQDLPLVAAAAGATCRRPDGETLAGFRPSPAGGRLRRVLGILLLLQKLACPPDFERIALLSEESRELLAFLQEDHGRVTRNPAGLSSQPRGRSPAPRSQAKGASRSKSGAR